LSLVIIGGSSAQALAFKVAKELNAPFIDCEYKKFPDGEKYIRVEEDVEGKKVALVQSMYLTPDEYLLEYFLLVDNLKDMGAREIIGVIPYFAYARQDARFKPGEALSLKTIVSLIEKTGTDKVFTVDMHLHRVENVNRLFKIPAKNLTAIPLLGEYVKKEFILHDTLVIGPDEEAEQWAKTMAETLGTEYDILEKKRLSATEVEIAPRELDVKTRDLVIVDDIISTGGTLAKTIEVLKKKGAKKIVATCTHPVLVENALKRIYKAGGDAVIGTDTIPSPVSYVSVAPLIAEALRKL